MFIKSHFNENIPDFGAATQADLDPLFYIRLVGPAIVVGTVKRQTFEDFDIEFLSHRSVGCRLYILPLGSTIVFYSHLCSTSLILWRE